MGHAGVRPSTPETAGTAGTGRERHGRPPAPIVELTLPVEGMTCAACATRVERGPRQLDGVVDAAVNLTTGRARVRPRAAAPGPARARSPARKRGGLSDHPPPAVDRAVHVRRSGARRARRRARLAAPRLLPAEGQLRRHRKPIGQGGRCRQHQLE